VCKNQRKKLHFEKKKMKVKDEDKDNDMAKNLKERKN
jgi:hypothetical protein